MGNGLESIHTHVLFSFDDFILLFTVITLVHYDMTHQRPVTNTLFIRHLFNSIDSSFKYPDLIDLK